VQFKAAILLKTSDKSVQDIAALCGYQRQGKFGAVFQEMYRHHWNTSGLAGQKEE
jgi:transcriptional regulator GlxA family with amidase domain